MSKLGLGPVGVTLTVSGTYLDEAAELERLGYSAVWLPGGLSGPKPTESWPRPSGVVALDTVQRRFTLVLTSPDSCFAFSGDGRGNIMAIKFTIDGSWFCNNLGDVTPVVGARVEFWQRVSSWVDWFDEQIPKSNTHTDVNGHYSVGFTSAHKHDFYARLVLNDDNGARLHNWWTGSSWSIDTPVASNTLGTIHHDLVVLKDGGRSTPKCAIWQGAHNAVQEYRQSIGAAPPYGNYDVALETSIFPTPFSTISTTHWPDGYTTIGGGPNAPYAVNFHEFGHTIRQSLDGDFTHFLFDVVRFLYTRQHSPTDCHNTNNGFAFNEGWAEFWATDWGASPPSAPCPPATNTQQEGDVAARLFGLSNCPGVSRAGMVAVLRANPRAIHSFPDFETALRRVFPRCRTAVPSIGDAVEHNAGEEIAIALDQRIEATVLKLQEQARVTESLRRSHAAAEAAAAASHSCDTEEACELLFQIVTGPPLLAGQIAQSELVSAQLKHDLDLLRGLSGSEEEERELLTRAGLYSERLAAQKSFDHQTFRAAIGATEAALAELRPCTSDDRTGTLAERSATLRKALDILKDEHAQGLTPPEGLQAPGADFGETISETRPKTRPLE